MAEIHHMSSLPPDMDNGAAPADGPGGGAGGPKREKRKKKVDTGKLQTLFRSWALQYCSQIAWDTETRAAYAIAGLRNQFGNDEVRMWLQSDKRRVVLADQHHKRVPIFVKIAPDLDQAQEIGRAHV